MYEEAQFPEEDRPAGDRCGPWHIRDVLAELLVELPEIEIEAAEEVVAAA